ncbi:unnamed protein product [Sphenostylis stenocarpa]|uniref:RING-type E3 ubiquitin transferase n=1 Tax=Sphenostylis stenocarpa TaxID=92480 RepID=A0AA86W580_9FABA|nr:unnamed protein product [Sphenostylis stenocarpa]
MDIFDDDHDHHIPYVPTRDESNNSNVKILFISMVSFIVVLFLVFSLYVYARCLLKRRSRHRAAVHRLTLAALHVSDVDSARSRVEPSNTGLDPAIIASLPTFPVKAKVLKDSGGGNDNLDASLIRECVVCLNALEGEEKVKLLPNCKHFFHISCIDTWLGSHSTCPLCRAEVKPRLEPHDREGPASLALDDAPLIFDGADSNSNNNDNGESLKNSGSNSRLSSFKRMLSRERSSRRVQPHGHDDADGGVDHDLERQ